MSNLISLCTAVPNTVARKLINIVSGFKNIYQIIIYALCSAHEKFRAKPGEKNALAVPK